MIHPDGTLLVLKMGVGIAHDKAGTELMDKAHSIIVCARTGKGRFRLELVWDGAKIQSSSADRR